MARRWLAMAYWVYLRTYFVCGVISLVCAQLTDDDFPPQQQGCDPGASLEIPKDDWMEKEVVMGFRVWQLMFLALAGIITVVVLLCCFMKCRVPRTKQEIEADFKRKEVTRRFRFLLDKVQIEDTSLRAALEKVNQLYNNREKMKRRKKKKVEDEENGSTGSSDLFTDEKLTIVERVKKILGILKEEESEAEDQLKGRSDPELTPDEGITKHSDSDEDNDDDEDSQIAKSQRSNSGIERQRSDSRDSALLGFPKNGDDLHSRMSLLHDSPPATAAAGRVCVYRDSQSEESSPPGDNFKTDGSRKRVDSMGNKKSESLESKQKTDSTDSQQSRDSDLGRKGEDSVESQDSGNKVLRKQNTDSPESNSSDSAKHRESANNQKRAQNDGESRQSSRNGTKSKSVKHNNGSSKLRKSVSKESKFSRSSSSKESSSLESKPRNSKGGSDKGNNSCDTPPV